MAYTPGLWLFILSSLILAGLFLFTWRYRQTETGRSFLFFLGCALIWVFFFILETASKTLEAKWLFARIQFLGIAFLPTAWIFLVYAYVGALKPNRKYYLFGLVPLLTNLVIWTNPLHHWFYGTPSIQQVGMPFPVLVSDYQFWFYAIHAPTAYIYMGIAIFLLIRATLQMEKIYRAQSRLLLLAILLPTLTDVLYVLGYSPIQHYNYTTAVFSLSGLIIAWTLFRFHFLDLLPLAREVVMENLDDGMIVFDHKKRVVEINRVALKIFHLTESVIGQPVEELPHPTLVTIQSLFHSRPVQNDIEISDPARRYYDLRISPVQNPNGLRIGWVATFRDITERAELLNKLQILAVQDSLTGAFNHRAFLDLARREISRAQRAEDLGVSVVMIDLDHFKEINDTYGHGRGDQVLVTITRAIQDQLRVYDVLGRLGGEEFGLLLVDVTSDETQKIVERLRAVIEAVTISAGDEVIRVTASFGIASSETLSRATLNIESLLNLADQALYQAKEAGRNCVRMARIDL